MPLMCNALYFLGEIALELSPQLVYWKGETGRRGPRIVQCSGGAQEQE